MCPGRRESFRGTLSRLPAELRLAGMVALLAVPVPAAFEGAELFRATLSTLDGIHSPALNSPARLPDQRWWSSVGRTVPFGQSWAAGQQLSLGGSYRFWRGAVAVWSSGDRLYKETQATIALAREPLAGFSAGASLTYNQVAIRDFEPVQSEVLLGFGLAGDLTDDMIFSLWYSGLAPDDTRAYESLARQLFQLALLHPARNNYGWALGLEKTPGFKLRQLLEISIGGGGRLELLLGYRTHPSLPFVGTRVTLSRLQLFARVNHHPLFGLSTAFGLALK